MPQAPLDQEWIAARRQEESRRTMSPICYTVTREEMTSYSLTWMKAKRADYSDTDQYYRDIGLLYDFLTDRFPQ